MENRLHEEKQELEFDLKNTEGKLKEAEAKLQAENEMNTIQEVHDNFVNACYLVLNQLRLSEEGEVVASEPAAWESFLNLSCTIATLSATQLDLLGKKKALTVITRGKKGENSETWTSQQWMKAIMLDVQRILYFIPKSKEKGKGKYLPNRKVKSSRGPPDGEKKFRDSLECLTELLEKHVSFNMQACLKQNPTIKMLQISENPTSQDEPSGDTKFESSLDGLEDGLAVPWMTVTNENETVINKEGIEEGEHEESEASDGSATNAADNNRKPAAKKSQQKVSKAKETDRKPAAKKSQQKLSEASEEEPTVVQPLARQQSKKGNETEKKEVTRRMSTPRYATRK